MKSAYLYFENGLFLEAKSFGADGCCVGEVVFNTSMSGYQEIISDPSYAGQFITFSMPEIGIVGCNPQDMESRGVFAKGVLVSHYSDHFSNFRAQESLSSFLKHFNVMGICRLPIRDIVKMIRLEGAMMMVASTEISDVGELKKILHSSLRIEEINYAQDVSTKESYTHKQGVFSFECMGYPTLHTRKKIVAIDFGIKRNILNNLVESGFEVEVQPHSFRADTLIQRFKKGELHAVFLSNGPGDPKFLKSEIAEIKILVESDIPIFAICLGHQLLAIAHGYPTYKLKFGHHGGNHPVKNLCNQAVEITAQNHIYSVPENITEIADITHQNLFDGTIEGLLYHRRKIYSIQHHPESSPGPKEANSIFGEFARMIE
ncbi:carbamoyl phosphate synthase small subunit [Helicobacter monodelphidis]|uniref:glutamine-hydrolyzing carbamoyl-phosphate synthase small subunit n=1 Tax=Helicobacter sp. 15-1451 TaxID=2004995 RepID=UPI000DCB854E|nr:glutamine-hydrolyzing carbamoyl-phosphate synthase small subunit [Helicobacter sp. 15-1451]RAX58679.1 carbamoyl phosphate synthase small subunit [Helicobacter sp. 15-1451]